MYDHLAPPRCFALSLTVPPPDKRGNRALIAICSANIVIYALAYAFYATINKRRDRIWNSWSAEVSIAPPPSSYPSFPFPCS